MALSRPLSIGEPIRTAMPTRLGSRLWGGTAPCAAVSAPICGRDRVRRLRIDGETIGIRKWWGRRGGEDDGGGGIGDGAEDGGVGRRWERWGRRCGKSRYAGVGGSGRGLPVGSIKKNEDVCNMGRPSDGQSDGDGMGE